VCSSDLDIALHLLRRQLLDQGLGLSAAITRIASALGVSATITPVSDDPLRTIVHTDAGRLAFQDYFVRLRCEPRVQHLEFAGAAVSRLAPALLTALESPGLAGVILCPSNPYLSIAPMLAASDLRARLAALRVPVIAVSPIVGGEAIKGPAAKMMRELGQVPGPAAIAELYADFLDLLLIDESDVALATGRADMRVADIVMKSPAARDALARKCLRVITDL
jgi:LPPG:FO 2-phospho-L-lactate transferase